MLKDPKHVNSWGFKQKTLPLGKIVSVSHLGKSNLHPGAPQIFSEAMADFNTESLYTAQSVGYKKC